MKKQLGIILLVTGMVIGVSYIGFNKLHSDQTKKSIAQHNLKITTLNAKMKLRKHSKEREGELAKSDEPDKFAEFYKAIRTREGETEPGYKLNYKFDELKKARSNRSANRSILPWVQRGPANVGGRTRGLIVDPDDPTFNTWFAGSVGGGIWNEGALTLMDSMVVRNSASENDGGITNLGTTSLIQSTVSDNDGEVGAGGIANFGTLNVYSSTIEYNRGGDGGGLKNLGDLFLDSSTVSGNEVFGNGGGLYNDAGYVKMINSTLSGNTADNGGGIYNQGASTIWITSATIANNSAASEGGGIFIGGGAGLVLRNTILSANAGENCHGIFGTVTNILVSSNDCNLTGTVIVADPQLGDLQDNGGPTETHALLDGSPALKAVPGEDCIDFSGQPLLTDQRGMPRIEGERCDIGAYELTYSRFLPLITR